MSERANVHLVVPAPLEPEVTAALGQAGGVIVGRHGKSEDAIEISAIVPPENVSSFGVWIENFRALVSASRSQLAERRLAAAGLLMAALAWVLFDWITVGRDGSSDWPPWADGRVRMLLLAFFSVTAGYVAVIFGKYQPGLPRFRMLLTLSGGVLMWASCAYILWRCYQYQERTGGSGSYWLVTGVTVMLPLAVADASLRLWTHFTGALREKVDRLPPIHQCSRRGPAPRRTT